MTTVDDRWVDLDAVLEEMRADAERARDERRPLNQRAPFSPDRAERPRASWETCDIPTLPRLVEPAPMTDPALEERTEGEQS